MGSIKAPFPYFGGKRRIAADIWRRFGSVQNYVEPFFGSGAVLLARPGGAVSTETINDLDGMIANFWRAVSADPDAVARWANWPVSEADLHPRHAWLMGQKAGLAERLMGDAEYYDAKIAGWWVWGACAWIGSGWCSGQGPWHVVDGALVKSGNAGQGINKQMPHVGDAGQGINKQMPHVGDAGRGIFIRDWMRELSDRLRDTRTCCGDWSRVLGDSVTTKNGTTAVFLDPPYDQALRKTVYTHETECSAQVREWAIEHGNDKRMRIALAGYDNEHGDSMPGDWEVLRWKANGGYGSQGDGRGAENASREVIWFSPHCLGVRGQADLFG